MTIYGMLLKDAIMISYLVTIVTCTGLLTYNYFKETTYKYKSIYILNTGDSNKIISTLKNIKNAYNDNRLKGQLQIELVVFGEGIELYLKSNSTKYEHLLTELKELGVVFVQCENTLKGRNLNKDDLLQNVNLVPSGNGEIILKQHQGWSSVHP